MSNSNFHAPQRQSITGIILIFATTLYKIIRSFWAVGLYFVIAKANAEILLTGGIALAIISILILVYSIFYFLKFQFFINEKNEEFVLHKGVFSSDVINIPFHKIQHVNFKRNILQRIIGVYSVVIDTAGSGDEEVEIQALSKERADELADVLMRISEKKKIEAKIPSEENSNAAPKTQWKYQLDFISLIKLGLTSHLFRGLAVLVAFYSTIQTQLGWENEYMEDLPDLQFSNIFFTLALIFVLLLFSILVNVVQTFIKYYNLNLEKKEDALQVEMGLRNNTKVNLKASRVQLLQEIINPVHERLNFYKLKIAVASSRDTLSKSKIEIPGLPNEIVERIKNYFYKAEIKPKYILFPHRMLLMRMILRRLWTVLLLAIVARIVLHPIATMEIVAYAGLAMLLISILVFFVFKNVKLSVTDNLLVKQFGLWSRKKQFLEMYKLQSVTISQPVFYRKRNLVNITFHSAAGDIGFSLIDKNDAQNLMNFLLYKIESTEKPWM